MTSLNRRTKALRSLAVLVLLACAGCASAGIPGGADAGPPGGGDPDAASGDPDATVDTPDSGGVMADADIDASGGGTPDAAGPCDLVSQVGCSGTTPACDLGTANAHECRAVTAPGMTTSTCADPTACAAGYSCVGGSAGRSCLRYCGGDGDCGGGAGALCTITLVDGAQNPIPGVTLCSQSCGPLDGTGCPATWGCHLGREPAGQMRVFTDCEPAGPGGKGAACTSNSSCQAGFQCLCTDQACTPTLTKCFKLCNATDNIGCPAGVTCQGFGGVVVGGKAWGNCP